MDDAIVIHADDANVVVACTVLVLYSAAVTVLVHMRYDDVM